MVHGRHRTGCPVYLGGTGTEPSPAPEWAVEALKYAASRRDPPPVELPEDLPRVDLEGLNLPDGLRHMILSGGLDRFASRSNAIFSASVQLVGLGFQDHEIAAILWDPGSAISDKPREQGLRWLAGDIGRARMKAFADHRETRGLVMGLAAWIDRQDWSGMRGATDWQVLLAHLSIVRRTGKLEYQASYRDLTEKVGIAKSNVVASSHRLRERGALELVRPGRRPNQASTWRLRVPTLGISCSDSASYGGSGNPSPITSPSKSSSLPHAASVSADADMPGTATTTTKANKLTNCVMYVPDYAAFHEIWMLQGLGKVGLRTWATLLTRSEWPIRELAQRLSVTVGQARRTLKRLGDHGLARKLGGARWRADRADRDRLDQIAAGLGLITLVNRRTEMHTRERVEYRAGVLARATARR